MKVLTVCIALIVLISGCARKSADIPPINTPVSRYDGVSCEDIHTKLYNKELALRSLCTTQDRLSERDTVTMTVGLFLFWPALIANVATVDNEEDIGAIKGDISALNIALETNGCFN